jgi:hypothetical protein
MDGLVMIRETLEELMKNRGALRRQMQAVDLMIRLLSDELRRREGSTKTVYGEPIMGANKGDWMA